MEDLPYKKETMCLEAGQTMFLYTDGVTEAMSPDNELFGLANLREMLNRKHDLNLAKLCSDIEASLSEYQQGRQFDDITMLVLKRNL
jgi:sigma-B regulation protein RsbU (phosphoserine phosphatase)